MELLEENFTHIAERDHPKESDIIKKKRKTELNSRADGKDTAKNGTIYRMLSKNIRKKYKQAKDEALDEKCAEIQILQNINITGKHKLTKEIIKQKTCFSAGCMKSKKESWKISPIY